MNVLLIQGSNHYGGNTQKVFDFILDQISGLNLKMIDFTRTEVSACLGCDYCLSHQNSCILQDEMQIYYEWIREADAIILCAPVYFCSFPSKVKAFIDRCQLFFNLEDKSKIKKKSFTAIHLGGSRPYPDQFNGLKGVYKYWLPDICAKLTDFIEIPSTDTIDPLEEKSIQNQILQITRKIMEEQNESIK